MTASRPDPTWTDVEVSEVRRSNGDEPVGPVHAAILQERGGDRRLPVYMGRPEAVALACSLESVEMPRPMTYQLAAALVAATGERVVEVRITRLVERPFTPWWSSTVLPDGPKSTPGRAMG